MIGSAAAPQHQWASRPWKRPFRSSSQAATCSYQSNHSKVVAIPLSALPKDTTSELAVYLHTIPFSC